MVLVSWLSVPFCSMLLCSPLPSQACPAPPLSHCLHHRGFLISCRHISEAVVRKQGLFLAWTVFSGLLTPLALAIEGPGIALWRPPAVCCAL